MSHVIYSRSANNAEIGTYRIQQLAPAVFADTVKDTLSPRYAQLRTADVLPIMEAYGYVPTQAAQKKSRKANPMHTQHMLAFAHRDTMIDAYSADANRGEIIIYNSHDGTGSIKMFAGAFRFICSNGIIAGDGFDARLYHNKANVNSFEQMLAQTVERLPALMDRIQQMKGKEMSHLAQMELAVRAAETRWAWTTELNDVKPTKGSFATGHTVSGLLRVQREADAYANAWTVFNRIQENVIRGGAMIKSFSERNADGIYRKSRPVNSVTENVRVNRELWNAAEQVLQLA
tara:strand:- start:283 stop:1149 length:867 start_codon:yes stop_codon:yes gene_type:complete